MSASCGRGKIAANPDMGFPAKIDKARQQIILAENPPPYRRRVAARPPGPRRIACRPGFRPLANAARFATIAACRYYLSAIARITIFRKTTK
jgi:hypothetical protein